MAADTTAIVPAAGIGKRFGRGVRKQYAMLGGRPVLAWVFMALERHPRIKEIVPVVRHEDRSALDEILGAGDYAKVKAPVIGGAERQDSVYNALKSLESPPPLILIHDGVRPFLSSALLTNVLEAVEGHDGAIAAVPPKDTIKEGVGSRVTRTLDRSMLWSVQTPQAFTHESLRRAYDEAMSQGVYSTDDSALVERTGGSINIVMGYYANIKVTTPEDLDFADAIIRRGFHDK